MSKELLSFLKLFPGNHRMMISFFQLSIIPHIPGIKWITEYIIQCAEGQWFSSCLFTLQASISPFVCRSFENFLRRITSREKHLPHFLYHTESFWIWDYRSIDSIIQVSLNGHPRKVSLIELALESSFRVFGKV